ncbi:MAG: DUF4830 domain-containing protein [Oscillospiraceae bacterium]
MLFSFVALGMIALAFLIFIGIRAARINENPPPLGGTNSERLQFLSEFGWEVKKEPISTVRVQIPMSFDEVYEKYNEIQRRQNFDLRKYAGKTVDRFCYVVTNYPNYPDDIRANLLICEKEIIGGDICSNIEPPFMHEFSYKQVNSANN